VQSSSQIVSINKPTPTFSHAGCLFRRPTISVKALNGKSITFHRLSHPKLTWGSSSLVLPLKAPGFLGVRIAKPLVSPLTPVFHNSERTKNIKMTDNKSVCSSFVRGDISELTRL